MSQASSPYPTLYEVLESVQRARGSTKLPSVVAGMKPEPIRKREGEALLTPSQLLNLRIPVLKIEAGNIQGYQRYLTATKARQIARWLIEHPNYLRVLSIAELSLDENGYVYATDGQHRAAGAIIAQLPLRVLLTKRTEAEARELFALQGKQSRPSRNLLILDGDGPYDEYIQDAVTCHDHPWSQLITAHQSGSTKTRMSATAALAMLRTYVGKSGGSAVTTTREAEARFDKEAADNLAILVSTFGTRATNPVAFSSTGLRAIAQAARRVFRDREPHRDDRDRWIRYMSRFKFDRYGHINSAPVLADIMVVYWNKRLPEDRRAS